MRSYKDLLEPMSGLEPEAYALRNHSNAKSRSRRNHSNNNNRYKKQGLNKSSKPHKKNKNHLEREKSRKSSTAGAPQKKGGHK